MDDRRLRNLAATGLVLLGAVCLPSSGKGEASRQRVRTADDALPSPERIQAVRAYIKKAWSTLGRSNRDLPRAALDPKMKRAEGQPSPVYLSPREDRERMICLRREAFVRLGLVEDAVGSAEAEAAA